MLILLADENFNNDIVRGVRRRLPAARIVTVEEEGLTGTADSELLELADERGLILLTHDVNTVPGFAKERLKNGKTHHGVFAVPQEVGNRRGNRKPDSLYRVQRTNRMGKHDSIFADLSCQFILRVEFSQTKRAKI